MRKEKLCFLYVFSKKTHNFAPSTISKPHNGCLSNLTNNEPMIQFITRSSKSFSFEQSAEIALKEGCKWIQLRMKPEVSDEEFAKTAKAIRELCNQYHAYFIIADRVHLVKEVKADGVFLANGDMSVEEARSILGPRYIISGKAHNFDEVKGLYEEGADHVGVGIHHANDEQSYSDIVKQMEEEHIPTTLFAYGDFTPDDVAEIKRAGVREIAISSRRLKGDEEQRKERVDEFVEAL